MTVFGGESIAELTAANGNRDAPGRQPSNAGSGNLGWQRKCFAAGRRTDADGRENIGKVIADLEHRIDAVGEEIPLIGLAVEHRSHVPDLGVDGLDRRPEFRLAVDQRI